MIYARNSGLLLHMPVRATTLDTTCMWGKRHMCHGLPHSQENMETNS